jgi:hypothetical protein
VDALFIRTVNMSITASCAILAAQCGGGAILECVRRCTSMGTGGLRLDQNNWCRRWESNPHAGPPHAILSREDLASLAGELDSVPRLTGIL